MAVCMSFSRLPKADFRRQGVATALIDFIKEYSKEKETVLFRIRNRTVSFVSLVFI